MHCGKKIREVRRLRDYSQNYVAQESGIPRPILSTIETGRTNPRPYEIERIAQVLGIDPSVLEESDHGGRDV